MRSGLLVLDSVTLLIKDILVIQFEGAQAPFFMPLISLLLSNEADHHQRSKPQPSRETGT